jgi:D-alanyl-D-alanine carboxypeptidase (penicillin-binding protein 5/6)
LQAIMLPSANNMADSLAIWAYGSLSAYTAAANAYMTELGLPNTRIGSDASGLAPDSVSTARDLVKLGELAMQSPVLAQIVSQATATSIPLTTAVKNVNFLLGTSNIIGVKTGNSDQAGGVYVSASKATVNNKPVVIVTALVGTPDLTSSVQGSLPLIRSAQTNFSAQSIIASRDTVVGSYHLPWGGDVTAIASKDFSMSAWNGTNLSAKIQLDKIAGNSVAKQTVGKVTAQHTSLSDESSIPVTLRDSVREPSVWWQIVHPIR